MIRAIVLAFLYMACGDDGVTSEPIDAREPDDPECDSSEGAFDTCTSDTICIDSRCEPAFPRTYSITDVRVTMPVDNAGAAWDPAPGFPPDILVSFVVDGGVPVTTPVAPDSSTWTFPGPFEVTLVDGAELAVRLFDDDDPQPTLAKACSSMVTAADLRGDGEYACLATASSPGSLVYRIETLP